MSQQIDLRPLKNKALNFPEPARSLILGEPDTIDTQDFIAKMGVWERLLMMTGEQ